MNRKEIKKEARARIKGNIWTLILPYLIVGLISGVISAVVSPSMVTDQSGVVQSVQTGPMLLMTALEFAMFPLSFGCVVYYLKFVRKEKVELKILFDQYKRFWPIFCLYFLIALFVGLWSLLLIIPGIIANYKYMMAPYLMADGEENAMEAINKSKAMMKGYKWDLFVFQLSFFWWYMLVGITFGLAAIYVGPYVTVAQTMYYEELKKATNVK